MEIGENGFPSNPDALINWPWRPGGFGYLRDLDFVIGSYEGLGNGCF